MHALLFRTSSCTWIVQSNVDDGIVQFRIVNFSVDASASCYADYLEIRDGSYRLDPKIIRWCGKKPASKIYKTTQNSAHFSFQAVSFGSDASGFSLQFWTTVKHRVRRAEPVLTVAHYILAGVAALILLSFIVTLAIIVCIRSYRNFERIILYYDILYVTDTDKKKHNKV
ncbi:bone morphogenetic protein 1-like [Gigantopelta aegis]|uniref:bone morphogenetic protein 1-like n=1 Tax=Gigantopelta aegis TaxID=1735272 RepID=UPI001B88C433|nr:bone morphogenetic protein 1-like [Gigantopelta aegis]